MTFTLNLAYQSHKHIAGRGIKEAKQLELELTKSH